MNPQTGPQPQIVDIRPIIQLDDRWPLWLWIVVIIAILLMAWAIYRMIQRFLKKKKQAPTQTKRVTPLDAYQLFQKQMQSLAQEFDDRRLYCFELSRIFRQYVENRYHFPATDRTSEEILRDLRRLYLFSEQDLNKIRDFFNLVDPVRYAAKDPSPQEVKVWTKSIVDLVERHRPRQETGVREASANV